MVVEAMLLQITVWALPLDSTVIVQMNALTSGQRQITFVAEPKTRGAGEDADV